MKLAVVTVTEKGVRNGLKIKEKIECDVFTISKFMKDNFFN